ncbi:hypothetical protein [Microscilla marina]|uniref:Effector-associated domain-containing protein n=1 Tax=Microscilla marina ATCC 23134 TaxID=313606 RepID=A1ZK28_MICM2|nr:hypothetical protein [Microscilla marina]EAY29481.1 hypothetical protein M23134_01541 [Microscilla marina ATCC 23134]
MPTPTEKIKPLINDGELDLALESAEKLGQNNINIGNAICLLKARYSELKNHHSINLIDYETYKSRKSDYAKELNAVLDKQPAPNDKKKTSKNAQERIELTLQGTLQNLTTEALEQILQKVQATLGIDYPIKIKSIQGKGIQLLIL